MARPRNHDPDTCPHCGGDLPSRDVYVPKEGFVCEIDGVETVLNEGFRFREGHPVVQKYPGMFRKIRVQYDIEERQVA